MASKAFGDGSFLKNFSSKLGFNKKIETLQEKPVTPAAEKPATKFTPFTKSDISKTGVFLRDMARALPRAGAKVGSSAGELLYEGITGKKATPEQQTIVPKTKFEKVFFGEEPIKTIQKETEEGSAFLEEKGLKKSWATPLAFAGSLGMTGLDLLPPVPGKKELAEKIVKETMEELVEKLTKDVAEDSVYKTLKQYNVADDIAQEFAPQLAKTATKEETQKVIREVGAQQVQRATKQANERMLELVGKESMNADELTELKFLQKNKDNPEALLTGYKTPEAIAMADDIPPGGVDDAFKIPGEELPPKQKKRKFITSIKASEEIAEELKTDLYGMYDTKSNKGLIERAVARVDDDIENAKRFSLENSTDEAVATRVAVVKHLSALTKAETDPVIKKQIAKEFKDIVDKYGDLATEEGRAVQANVLLGQKTPEGMIRQTSRIIKKYNKETKGAKVPNLNEDDIIHILDESDKISKLPDGFEKQKAVKKLMDTLEAKIPSPIWEKIVTVWKAGLLTGIKTSGLNILSTFFHGVAEIAKDVPATVIDMASSLATGKRTKAFTFNGFPSGAKKGFKEGWNYLRTGVSERDIPGKLDFNKVNFGESKAGKALKAYTDSVFRVLGSEDQVFYWSARARSLYEQALVAIKNEKKVFANAADKDKFIQNFVTNPTDEVLEMANNDALTAVFQNDTALGRAATGIRDSLGVPGKVILPFAKTPSAVAMQMLNYSPVGIIKSIVQNVGKGKFNQKEFAEALGRGVTGTAALWAGYELFNENKINLGYPKDEKEREKWKAEGRTPNSILLGNKWVPLINFGQIGSIFAVGGYIRNGVNETGSLSGGIMAGLFGGVKNLTEQTFLTGVRDVLDAINEPDKKGIKYAERLAGSVVPTIVSDFANAFDEFQRQPKGIFEAVKARIPGARQTVPKRLDVYGQPIGRNRSTLGTAISPIRLSNPIQNEFNTEIERLKSLGEDVRLTKIDQSINGIKLDDKEFYLYQRMYGKLFERAMTALIKNPDYQKLDPDSQAKLFTKSVKEIKAAVRENIFPDLIIKRYDLPKDLNKAAVRELMNKLGKDKRFTKAPVEKQERVIKKILGIPLE